MAKRDGETGSELLAMLAATEKVLVAYEFESRQHDAEAEDSQNAIRNESRRILGTPGLLTIYRTPTSEFAIAN